VSPRKFSGRFLPRTLWPPHQGHFSETRDPDLKSQNRSILNKKLAEPPATHLHVRLCLYLQNHSRLDEVALLLGGCWFVTASILQSLCLKCQRAVPYQLFLAKPLVPLPLIHEWLSLRTPPRSASRARARTEVFLSKGTYSTDVRVAILPIRSATDLFPTHESCALISLRHTCLIA
jgi:hypothetical protein